MSENRACHIHAVELPFGTEPVDWWIVDGRLTRTPVEDAGTLPGAFVAPGLVDAHAHLTMDMEDRGIPRGRELYAANARANLAAGVTVVRDAGWVRGFRLPNDVEGLQVISCGPLFVPAGCNFYEELGTWVAPGSLVAAVEERVAGGAGWVKIIADFPGPDRNWFAAPATYPIEEVRDAAAAAHAGGARMAAHVSSGLVGDLIRAGVDSIEHGPLMTPDLVDEMAERGTAWVPTLSTVFAKHLDPLTVGDTPIAGYLRSVYAGMEASLARTAEIGVPVLAGTDERAYGSISLEIEQLRRFGLSAAQALASATTWAREYFGLAGLEEGAVADVVLFDADPRFEPDAEPRRVTHMTVPAMA